MLIIILFAIEMKLLLVSKNKKIKQKKRKS